MLSDNVVLFPGAQARHADDREPQRRTQGIGLERLRKRTVDATALTALIAIPSIAIAALFLGVAWAMWTHHAALADRLGPNGALWAWGGYAMLTGTAYAWTMRRFPPAIFCAWSFVLFMVLVAGWAHVSFGPAAITAAAGIAILRAGGR